MEDTNQQEVQQTPTNVTKFNFEAAVNDQQMMLMMFQQMQEDRARQDRLLEFMTSNQSKTSTSKKADKQDVPRAKSEDDVAQIIAKNCADRLLYDEQAEVWRQWNSMYWQELPQ